MSVWMITFRSGISTERFTLLESTAKAAAVKAEREVRKRAKDYTNPVEVVEINLISNDFVE